ncbi:hypothetical protein C498_05481 [Haloferax volcanii DS2]|uniref:Uncharacterized protein n=2 Tax=Haloferax volcanii (strain ATCC 29605 / DSM 3757 / JCM 8879 / NBRC 14742 / NCIMB 2012 / VKM B-1768 / DS2) TaxID=309800 RepID=L9VBZ3_HALVD|nr:hypothetical protein C498_05481 [Haloferax volcanii DS2]
MDSLVATLRDGGIHQTTKEYAAFMSDACDPRNMSSEASARVPHLLMSIGGLALVSQSVVFEGAFGLVTNPGVSGGLRDVLSGGLLLVSMVCFFSGIYLQIRMSR